jgi:pimeloyl-ACP methyl ester carboxylesterase
MRPTAGGPVPFLEPFDRYLNNAGISLLRFTQAGRGPADLASVLRECRALLTVLRERGHRITLLTFGSAARAGLTLAAEDATLQLVLVGPPARPYLEVLRWRLLEEPNRHFAGCFDIDGDGRVTRDEFGQDIYRVRNEFYRGVDFSRLDRDGNGVITAADFTLANRERWTILAAALTAGKEDARAAAILGPAESLRWAASLTASSTVAALRRLGRPVFILHGSDDRRIPAAESRLLQSLGIPGLVVHIEGGHDHELNWNEYGRTGTIPGGLFQLLRVLFHCSGLADSGP